MSSVKISLKLSLRAAAIQMHSTPDRSHNLAQARELLMQALDQGAELIAFPENFSIFTHDSAEFLKSAETLQGLTVETLREWAAENDVWILGGSIPIKTRDPKRVTNTSLLISSDGDIAARYDKIHLFDVALTKDRTYQESREVRAGTKVVSAETPWGRMGLSICYDLRFPELYRKLIDSGAQLLFAPSAFLAYTGKAHWDLLTRARAVENQAFMIAPAQFGSPFEGRETHGHTRIVDPWGRILAERPKGTGTVVATLDLKEVQRIRREMPALEHRKL